MTDKIKEKLGKIKAMADSAKAIGNEHEAQAFAAMLQNLLAKHKLEMTDIEYAQHQKEEPVEQFAAGGGRIVNYPSRGTGYSVYKDYPDIEIKTQRSDWQEMLAATIAEAHSCRILVSQGTSMVWFVGRPTNVQVVDYLYMYLLPVAESLADKAYKSLRSKARRQNKDNALAMQKALAESHGYKSSFLKGFISRLLQRFQEEKDAMFHDSTGVALARVNKDEEATKEYLAEKDAPVAKSLNRATKHNSAGFKRGVETANQLDISKTPSKSLGGGQ